MSASRPGAAADRLDHLARTAGPGVLAYLARRTTPVEDAADVYAQVLTITWRKLAAVPADDDAACAWMFGVARRCLANHRRGATRRTALADRLRRELPRVVSDPDPAAVVDAERALSRLSDDDRELVRLVYWDELPVAMAAEVLRISAAAARKRLERARAALRAELALVE